MLILIRHAKVLFNWEKKYTASGFAAAQAAYDQAPIERISDVQIQRIRDALRCFIYEKDEDYFKGLKIKR